MKIRHNLAHLKWTLSGWTPDLWRLLKTMEVGVTPDADLAPIPAKVPGSVQGALRDAGLLPDWNEGLNSRLCEWVEHRHWIYETALPDKWIQPGRTHRLSCQGLDYSGSVWLNGNEVGQFCGTHVPHVFDLTPHLLAEGNTLRIVFDLPPRWLGQFGYTSRVREWKPRFNYTWDWIPRLVQLGIWDTALIAVTDGRQVDRFGVTTDIDENGGRLWANGSVSGGDSEFVRVALIGRHGEVREQELSVQEFNEQGLFWEGLPVERWWPNLEGEQPLYEVLCTVVDTRRIEHDTAARTVGFRRIEWQPCEAAPAGADPWLCVVNGRPVFLQGVNFPPLLPNYADLTPADYVRQLTTYRDLGVNTLRVNGCGYLEKEWFYELCDKLGILVWQDAPLSSSGVDNFPPDDDKSTQEMAKILESYIARRQHHPCLLLWCGGNELMRLDEDGRSVPVDLSHPLIARLAQVVRERDPLRRFLPSTATGPRFNADAADFGKGLHWNVHGPWKPWDDLTQWEDYFSRDDALFRAETGAPGTCSAEIIRQYAGDLDVLPVSAHNPLWRRNSTWWIESDQFAVERGRPPETLEEYVDWSQERQARALSFAVAACKSRFPRCGGVLLWCGHDCYPCAANTSILDFHGDPKPAALALKRVWRGETDPPEPQC